MKKIVKLFLCLFVFSVFISFANADTLIFLDNFSAGLTSKWTTGTNTAINSSLLVSVQGGLVECGQGGDLRLFKSP